MSKIIYLSTLVFLISFVFVQSSNAVGSKCSKLLYSDFEYGELDPKLESTMDAMFLLYKKGKYEEIVKIFSTYKGSAIWIPEHFVGAVYKKIDNENSFIYLNSEYGEKNYSVYSAIINALILSHGLIYQDYGEDLTPDEILAKWINDESPDHIKYAAQMHSSNHFGGYRRDKESLNYGSSLAHLLFMRDNLKIKKAEKYASEVAKAIDQLGTARSAKMHKNADLILSILKECNEGK